MKNKFNLSIASVVAILSIASTANANPTSWGEYSKTLLTENPNCTDVALGHNVYNNNGSRYQSESRSKGGGGGGSVGFKGFTLGANGHRTRTNSNSSANNWNRDRRILETGRNCDSLNYAVGGAIQSHIEGETRRYEADALERMNQNDNKTQRYVHRGLMQQHRLDRGFARGNTFQYRMQPASYGHYGLQ